MIVKDSSKNLNCFKGSLRYFAHKGLYLILINLVPAVLIPFVLSPSTTMYYLYNIGNLDTSSLGAMLRFTFDIPYSYWYIGVIGIVLLIFTVAITLGVIDGHMRVGEFTVSPRMWKSRLNYNILTAIKGVVVAAISLEFYNVVATLLYYLWANVFSSPTMVLMLSIITFVLMELGMIFTMSCFILWPPYMLHTGMRSGEALKTAWSSISGRLFQTVLGIVVAVMPIQAVMAITAALDLGGICRTVLDAIAYAVIMPFYFVVMYNTFYEVTGTERMDLTANSNKRSIWSKR
ncbi:MAG: hypothetical protein K2M36_05160 [Clostridia bacterium]|nr:hypothetical protein [Clostridia bacterium]